MSKPESAKARAVGINHVAIEVGDIGEALAFYGQFLAFTVEEETADMAIVYFGDQFINFIRNADRKPDQSRHFGIAVDDKPLARRTLEAMGVRLLDSRFLDFLDPWGNRVEITTYTNIQFTKADHVLRGMGLSHLKKSDEALKELDAKGMAPPGKTVAHWELWSRDPARIADFLTTVFGWNVQFIPEMNYRLVENGAGSRPSGGIMTPQEGPWPGNMSLYVDVEDLEASNRKIEQAGGKIVVERVEIPGMGAMSLFADPDGRVLGLWQRS